MQKISDITVVILAGGKGTRLRSIVSDRPKVMAEISGRPFLAYLLDQLQAAGFRKIILSTGYMAEKVEDYFGDSYGPLKLVYSKEQPPLGTGGALKLALPNLSQMVLVMNGDSYIDADLFEYTNWFFDNNPDAALLLTTVDDASRYGKVCINDNKVIAAFEEKCDNSGPGWINAGVYFMKKSLISSIPAGKFYSLERDLFPNLAGKKLFGFRCNSRFIDIGTPESYVIAEDFFTSKRRM
jgi:D-glycero-alpha-D-manno-heptose 1-phosphate guanylyltransferase